MHLSPAAAEDAIRLPDNRPTALGPDGAWQQMGNATVGIRH
jgi:hypothetical protein